MKGIVFKELINMVENIFGDEVTEKIIDQAQLASEGAYTSVGTYDHREILALVTQLSKETQMPVDQLIMTFGKHLIGVFRFGYSDFFKNQTTFSFLKSVHGIIHVEVKKLYPDAELPSFKYEERAPDELIMIYNSTRPFAALAEGLILGIIEFFEENISPHSEDTSGGKGTSRIFVLKKESS